MPAAEVNGVRLFYEDTGGLHPAVVFSHGILMDHEMFAPQVDALRDEFRCITWDERGHGDTEAKGSFTYWDSARDLLGLLDFLEIDKAILVGMSQGGFLSLRAALLAPERVTALVFIDTHAGPEDPDVIPGYEAMVKQWSTVGPSEHMAQVSAEIVLSPAPHDPWIAKWMARPKGWIVQPFNTLISREDLHDRLFEITCPALVIHGEADPAVSIDKAEKLCAELPNCEGVVRIPGGGHASNLSHPDQVNEALLDFCRRHVSV